MKMFEFLELKASIDGSRDVNLKTGCDIINPV